MVRSRGPGAAHALRRADILAAVQRVAASKGISAVSQSAVAREAGVSPGRVQHYFPLKDELLAAAFAELNEASSERIRARIGDLDTAPPRLVLETVLGELIPRDEVTRAHVQFRQAYTALALHHGPVADRLRAHYHQLHHVDLAALVRRDRDAGLVAADVEPEDAAIGLAALAEGLAYYVLVGICGHATARDRVLAGVAELYPAAPLRLESGPARR